MFEICWKKANTSFFKVCKQSTKESNGKKLPIQVVDGMAAQTGKYRLS